MWAILARFILRNRIFLLIAIGCATAFMAYEAFCVKIAWNFPQVLPASDSASIRYNNFTEKFGLDGTVLFAGMQEGELFSNPQEFGDWYDLTYQIKKMSGVKEVLSAANLFRVIKTDSPERFKLQTFPAEKPANAAALDSIKKVIFHLPFYEGFLLNRKNNSTLIAVTFKENDINSVKRLAIVDTLKKKIDAFAQKYHTVMHYSGMPYIRTVISRRILHEMTLFLFLAIAVTSLALFLFFRSFFPVIFPMLIVITGVCWSMGFLQLFGYRLSALTSLIAPLITVIGVPNSILLLNKYHTEYRRHQNQGWALSIMIRKIGISLFLANVTTAIGFAVFCYTRSEMLFQFGIVTSLGVMATYLLSLTLIPIIFSLLPPPHTRQLHHLEHKYLTGFLSHIDSLTRHNRKLIYTVAVLATLVSFYGISRIKAVGHVVDDLPEKDPVYADMNYFVNTFGGVLPLEVEIDTPKPDGIFADNGKVLYRMEKLERLLKSYSCFSRPISLLEGLKFMNQAYHNQDYRYFIMPSVTDLSSISHILQGAKQKESLLHPFIDSLKQVTRLEVQMADIGSVEMKKLLAGLRPRTDSIFNYDYPDKSWLPADRQCKVTFTGNCLIFLRGNDFLLTNLMESIALAIILVSLVLYLLFTSSPLMVFISTVPSLLPQIITLGLMGFFNIPLKPSTILIFSIAFGISSDGTMYFLAKYKQEIKRANLNISQIISLVIRETGVSMVYTALILSCGFLIFVFSGFGGTRSLGILLSVTLLMAYCSNLILLPSFMLSVEKRLLRKMLSEKPIIELEEENEETPV